MSQFYVATTGGNLPPVVPTSFVTDDGTAIPAANILLVDALDSIEDNDSGITTKGGVAGTGTANEVDIVLTNRVQGTASVTGAVTGDIITFSLAATSAVYRFEFKVAGRDTTSGDGVGYSVFAAVRTDGATATVIETPFYDADEDASLAGALIGVVASGNSIILQSTGVAGQTIAYSTVGYYVVV